MKLQTKILSLHAAAAAAASLVSQGLIDAQHHPNYTTLTAGMCVDSDNYVFSGLRYNVTAGDWRKCGNLCETLNTLPYWNNHNGISTAGSGAKCTCLYDSEKSIPQNLPDGWFHYNCSTSPLVGFGKVKGSGGDTSMTCMQRKCYPDCGPLSYDIGLSDFEAKSVGVSCDVTSGLDLVCNATTDAFKGGTMKTSLSEGSCEAGTPAFNTSSSQTVKLNPSLNCKNSGTCNFTHCFCGDYSFNSFDVLSKMSEISTIIMFDKEGAWSANVTTGAFSATEATASANRDVVISAAVGACGTGRNTAYNLGDTVSICISTADSDVQLSLKSVFANPGGQELVDAEGNAYFITQVKPECPNRITLETLMIPTYYDSQDGNAGNVTISGNALITYTRRGLLNGHHLHELEVKPFSLGIPLIPSDITPGVVQPLEIDTSSSLVSAYSVGVLVATVTGAVVSFF